MDIYKAWIAGLISIFKRWQVDDWIAAYAALVATATFIWTAWLQRRDRHRLKVYVGVTFISPADDLEAVHTKLLGGSVTNIGTRTAYLKSVGGLLANGRHTWYAVPVDRPHFFSVPASNTELQPGQSIDFRMPLGMITGSDVVAFIATDVTGRPM